MKAIAPLPAATATCGGADPAVRVVAWFLTASSRR
jgi:hypothetical protein